MRVDLIWIQTDRRSPPVWGLGDVYCSGARPALVAAAVSGRASGAPFVLFWDDALGDPDESAIEAVVRVYADVDHADVGHADVWHVGLSLGMAGLPSMIDYVDPVWRFNRDPDPEKNSSGCPTSWRLSLRACLVRSAVLDRLGGPDPHFDTLAGASLELGHRWIRRGALMRYTDELLPAAPAAVAPALTLNDEVRFLCLRYGRMWAAWACWRRWRCGGSLVESWRAFRRPQLPGVTVPAGMMHPVEPAAPVGEKGASPSVSVLIPTLDRYPHLFNLLDQLRDQTVRPLEIVVIDQTAAEAYDPEWPSQFADLPLRVIRREQPGQCSSRNAGLEVARGQMVLFLDDDDEVGPDLIRRHLQFLARFDADASCGVAEEVGAGPLPSAFRLVRDSDVFPTNNTMLKTAALAGSGLFDLAFERGERADHDLGMRLYLSGANLVLNPAASVIHLHAPRGGLRQHKARVVTRSSSRGSLRERQFLAPTEAYLWQRYFTPEQVEEALLIRTIGTVRGSGPRGRRLLRAVLMGALLPDTWRKNRARLALGRAMLNEFPAIPEYAPDRVEELWTA